MRRNQGGKVMNEQDQSQPEQDPPEKEAASTIELRLPTELVLLCYSRRVDGVIAGLTGKAEQAGEIVLPAEVFWDGRTRKRWLGVIVLTSEGAISPAFLEKLDRDPEILDYFVAPRESSGGDQEEGSGDALAEEEKYL
jgi:hypothetical protein